MTTRASRDEALVETLRELAARPWMRLRFTQNFRYQSCRFCKRSVLDTGALWKYGVRHYICDPCRDERIA
jgi:hypothetical protein